MIYYNERTHTKQKPRVAKCKEIRSKLLRVLSRGATQEVLYPLATSHDNTWKASSTGKLSARTCAGCWLYRHFLPHTYENPRLPDRNQAFSIIHFVRINSSGMVIHSFLLKCWESPNPSFQMKAKSQSPKHIFPS